MDKWVQQGLQIQALEGTIKALENFSSKYLEENPELRHEINKLKEQIKDEQKAHEANKVILEDNKNELEQQITKFENLDAKIKNKKTWKGSIQPSKTVFKEDVRQRIRGVKEKC